MNVTKICLIRITCFLFVLGISAIAFGVFALRRLDSKNLESAYTYKCGILISAAGGLVKLFYATIACSAIHDVHMKMIGFSFTVTGLSAIADFCLSIILLIGRIAIRGTAANNCAECVSSIKSLFQYGDGCFVTALVSAFFQVLLAYLLCKHYYKLIDKDTSDHQDDDANISVSSFGANTSHIFGTFPSPMLMQASLGSKVERNTNLELCDSETFKSSPFLSPKPSLWIQCMTSPLNSKRHKSLPSIKKADLPIPNNNELPGPSFTPSVPRIVVSYEEGSSV